MGKYWKTSIAASYVPREIEEMIERYYDTESKGETNVNR